MRMPHGVPDLSQYKYTGCYELAVPLIETCNMACEFCFENQGLKKKSPGDPEKIRSLAPRIVAFMKEKYKEHPYKQIDLKLWGGEVFYDALPDEFFSAYKDFVAVLKRELHVPFTIVYLSNGMFTKYERVLDVLEETDGYLSISYDPVGRYFNEGQKRLFCKTLDWFRAKGRAESISITLSKPTIEAYIKGDPVYEALPLDMVHIVNFYIPNREWARYVPGCNEYYAFYRWAIDNRRFNIDVINKMMLHMIPEQRDKVHRMCNCKEAAQWCGNLGRCSSNCIDDRVLDIDCKKYFYGDAYDEVTEENHFEVRSSMTRLKNGCVYCAHFSTCPMMCPASSLFTEYDASFCPMKKIYDEVRPEDIQAFENWQEWYRQHNGRVSF